MAPLRKLLLPVGFLASFFCNGAVASYLDFTDDATILPLMSFDNGTTNTNGFMGSIDGIGFTLSTLNSYGIVNFTEKYDGSANTGCLSGSGPLACNKLGDDGIGDGVGIGNDEITGLFGLTDPSGPSGQILRLEFDTVVYISNFDFLDLYVDRNDDRNREQVRISIDGIADPFIVNATGSFGEGGYARLDLLALGPILGQVIEFTAFNGDLLMDDTNNDYAFAAMTISAVPVPAAAWLFGTALIGLAGFSKRRKSA